MSSSAVDSQLATARSQLRFQSAAFSSSLQTATQAILDQHFFYIYITEEEIKKNMKKHTRKILNFKSSDGIAQGKLSLEQPYFFFPPVAWLKQEGVIMRFSRARQQNSVPDSFTQS